MEKCKLTPMMINHLNLILEKEGSCLRYKESLREKYNITYELRVDDKYVSTQFNCVVNVSKEFDAKVRNFFKEYGVTDIGFVNTVKTLFAIV